MQRPGTVYAGLSRRWPDSPWLAELSAMAEARLASHPHGDLPRWQSALARLPAVEQGLKFTNSWPDLGSPAEDTGWLGRELMEWHPWRKGPLRLGGVDIYTEWRSDWKWDRIAPHVDLAGHRILDIGCGNGYFGLRMLEAGARLVIGIDPTLLFVMQYLACRHFTGDIANYVLPLGIEDLPGPPAALDAVFSMGVLYHRRDPHHHLERIRSLLKTDGTLVLETLVLPQDQPNSQLVPEGRYARMRNVWAIPGIRRLAGWVDQAGFSEVRVVDVTPTTTREQRTTRWMCFESLEQALDPDDDSLTVEGLPAPVRAVLIARNR